MATTSFESKFGILADSLLGDKLPSVRKGSLGFQVVASEDDNERAIGIMAYRISNRLVYVPVFWISGRLKGGEIMYLKEEDTFRPFTEVWVNYISTGKDFKAGELSGKDTSRKGGAYRVSTMDLNWLHSKRAGDIGIVDVNDLKGMARMADETDGMVDLATNLKAFSPKAAADLANALVSNTTLANALFTQYTPTEIGDIIGGRLKEATPAAKQASAPQLEIICGRDDVRAGTLSKEEKLELARTGIVVRDNRKEAAEAFVVKQEAVSSWAPPRVSGTYEVLTRNFDTEKRVVFVHVYDANINEDTEYGGSYPYSPLNGVVLMQEPSKKMMIVKSEKLPLVNGAKEPGNIEIGEAVTAEALRALLPAKASPDPFNGDSVSVSNWRKNRVLIFDSKQAVMGSIWAGDDGELTFGSDWAISSRKPIILTKKAGELFRNDCWYIPSGAKMIALKDYTDTEMTCAPARVPDSTMINSGYLPVKVACEGKRWTIESRAGVHKDSAFSAALGEMVSSYGLRAKQAMEILEDAKTAANGLVFYVKSAEDPDIITGDDRTSTREVVTTKGLSNEAVQNIAKASEAGVKEVLDISILKEMADSKYPLDRVEDTLPSLAKALDRLCRNLFYFYWHNESFEDRFGAQSLDQLEDALKENIQALGDLVMYLQEKQSLSDDELMGGDKDGDLTDNMR